MVKLSYEQPGLKKYGTMRELTFSSGGSGGDSFGAGNSPPRGGDPKPLIINNADVTGGVSNTNDVQGNTSKDFATIRNSDR